MELFIRLKLHFIQEFINKNNTEKHKNKHIGNNRIDDCIWNSVLKIYTRKEVTRLFYKFIFYAVFK